MPSKRASRKRQSRLAFSPLPSSSPAASGYNKQIKDRAATVRYEGSSQSPRKRRKIVTDSSDGQGDLDQAGELIPTPNTTAERIIDGGSDSEPVRSTQMRSTRRHQPRQGRLDFMHHTRISAPSSSFDLSSPTGTKASGIFGRRRTRNVVELSSDDEIDTAQNIQSGASLNKESRPNSKKSARADNDEDDNKAGEKEKNDHDHDSQKSIKARPMRATRAQSRAANQNESDDDTIVVAPKRTNHPEQLDDQSSSDEDMPTTQGKQKRRARKAAPKTDDFIDDDSFPELDESDESDDVQIVAPPRKKHKRQQSASEVEDDDEDEDEDDVPRSSRRGRLQRSRTFSKQEKNDLDEDLDFLGRSSDVEDSVRRPRSTQSAKKTATQEALERLKQKRSGLAQSTPTIVEEDEEQEDSDVGDLDEGKTASYGDAFHPPPSTRAMFEADEEDGDFLEEDPEDGELGVEDAVPIEFTRYGRMKPKELFKFAVEWMVQKKLNPAFAIHDQLYDLTFRKLNDEVRGLAGSKFTSAAWTPEFTRALQARPEVNIDSLDRGSDFLRDKCDACNRTSHPATYQMQFTGQPYFPDSLAEVDVHDNDDDDDDDDDDSSASEQASNNGMNANRDHQGFEIPPPSTIFYVGRFCKGNAETAHALQHWKYHLNEWVATWLIRNGYDCQKEIARRDKMSHKKRRKHANKVTDRMEQEGVVKDLWREFKNNVSEARFGKIQGRFDG